MLQRLLLPTSTHLFIDLVRLISKWIVEHHTCIICHSAFNDEILQRWKLLLWNPVLYKCSNPGFNHVWIGRLELRMGTICMRIQVHRISEIAPSVVEIFNCVQWHQGCTRSSVFMWSKLSIMESVITEGMGVTYTCGGWVRLSGFGNRWKEIGIDRLYKFFIFHFLKQKRRKPFANSREKENKPSLKIQRPKSDTRLS